MIAANTDNRLTRDLILDAVPYSCVNMAETREIWSCRIRNERISNQRLVGITHLYRTFGGMIRLIIDVPALEKY